MSPRKPVPPNNPNEAIPAAVPSADGAKGGTPTPPTPPNAPPPSAPQKTDPSIESLNEHIDALKPIEDPIAKHRRELDTDIHRMYDDTGTTKPDMTKLDQVRHSTLKKLLIGLMAFFAVLATIAWAGVFFFTPANQGFGGEGVALDVEGPSEVKSGETVTYALHYRNGEAVALGTSSLELRLPKSFKVTSTDPAADQQNSWSIGAIAPGKDGLVTVKGIFVDAVDRDLDMQAILTYRPADFNSEFQKVTTKGVKITESVLTMEVTGPSKVLPGDKVTLTYAYKNESDNDFQNVKLRAVYPPSFIPEKTEPAALGDALAEWDIASLPAGGEGKVEVTGSFASDAEGTIEVKGQLGFLGTDDTFQLQREAGFTTDVLKGDLVTALILNGRSESQAVRFGDTLRFTVTYKNTGAAALGDVELSVTLDPSAQGNLIRWNDLIDKAQGVRDGNTITWTEKQIPSLGRIDAGDEGTLDFQVPVIDAPIDGAASPDYQFAAALQAKIATIDGAQVDRVTRAAPITAKFVSDAKFDATGAYFNSDDIPVGTGPLPPKVGEATTYRVTWRLTNSLHELSDLKISAKLPPNARWNGFQSVDAGNLSFDAAAEKMVWMLNRLPTDISSLSVSFDVSITPTDDQRGHVPTLIEGAIFEAKDITNGYPLLLSAPPITTAGEGDSQAASKGKVE